MIRTPEENNQVFLEEWLGGVGNFVFFSIIFRLGIVLTYLKFQIVNKMLPSHV